MRFVWKEIFFFLKSSLNHSLLLPLMHPLSLLTPTRCKKRLMISVQNDQKIRFSSVLVVFDWPPLWKKKAIHSKKNLLFARISAEERTKIARIFGGERNKIARSFRRKGINVAVKLNELIKVRNKKHYNSKLWAKPEKSSLPLWSTSNLIPFCLNLRAILFFSPPKLRAILFLSSAILQARSTSFSICTSL